MMMMMMNERDRVGELKDYNNNNIKGDACIIHIDLAATVRLFTPAHP